MLAKPDRMQPRPCPDEALLARLKSVRLADAAIPEHEFLQFRRLQSLIYTLRLAGYDVEAMQTEAFVGAAMVSRVKGRVIVTRCEYDMDVNDSVAREIMPRLYPDAIWLTSNASAGHARVMALPLGLTDYCGYTLYHPIIGDTGLFARLMAQHPCNEKNLVLMNFNDRTFPVLRGAVRRLFESKSFVSGGTYTLDGDGYARYVESLRSNTFCLAPRGTGIDTHRIWECLYAGGIPIVQKDPALRSFQDLPIFFVDRWEEATDAAMLERVRDEFHQREWNLEKLTVSYWYKVILRLLHTPAG
ncbi:MAG TPA: hypothetical protein VNW15_03960 [Rhizomicrobium sp.]|jgi:hypothetical protein|nr:hypothetical protein [Rhizomicrobium sp.]